MKVRAAQTALLPALLATLPLALAATAVRADEPSEPPAPPQEEPGERPEEEPEESGDAGGDGSEPEKGDAAAGAAAKPRPKAPDLVEPPPALARLLKASEDEAEPGRELKRAFLSILHYLVSRDVDRLLPYFHPDLRVHVGQGDLEAMPPAALGRLLRQQAEAERRAGGPAPRALADVLVKGSLRVYSRARALEAEGEAGYAEIDPARVAKWMKEGDWLIMARLRDDSLPREVFYVFRRHRERFKAVLAE